MSSLTRSSHGDVPSFTALVATPFTSANAVDVNALCWRRRLVGDFREVAHALAPAEGVVNVDVDTLTALRLSPEGRLAAAAMVEDMARLEALGCDPTLNCITNYPHDARGFPIATDVMSFHVDRAPTEVDTWLCTYWGKSSEILLQQQSHRLIDSPAIRAALYAAWDGRHESGPHEAAFVDYLREENFDLHHGMGGVVDDATPVVCGVGNLWKLAVAWPGSPVAPAIHRAPRSGPGSEPRLLMIA